MSKQKPQITTLSLPITGNESSGGNNLLGKYLFHWPLFILGALIAITGAYFYIKSTNPVYPVLATLKFKTATTASAGIPTNPSIIEQDLDPINKPVIVENEIEVMQSKKLVFQVVNALHLWVNYSQKKKFLNRDLYRNTPVNFEFIKQNDNLSPGGEKLDIVIKNHNTFLLKDSGGVNRSYSYSTPIKSAFGTWQLTPTAEFDSFIGNSIKITIQDPDIVSDNYQSAIKVVLENKDAPFVNLSTSDVVPQRGKDVLNSLLANYIAAAIEDKNKQSQNTLKFIDFRLDSLRDDLNSTEKKIEDYKSSQGMTDIVSQAQSTRDLKQANIRAMNDVEVNLGTVASLEKYASSSSNTEKLPASSASLGDNSLSTLYDKLSDLVLKREQLLTTVPETSPLVSALNKQIAQLKGDFKDKVGSIKSVLLAQKNELQSYGNQLESTLRTIPAQEKEYTELKRYQETKEKIYTFLLEKREQVSLKYASSISDSEIVDDAHAGKSKWPNIPVVYGMALIIGLAAAVGLLYLRESLNDRITSRKQIEDETEVPILGELSYQESTNTIVVSEGRSKFAIGEQFRVLRTNLFHLHGTNESGRVTLFTSSVSSEGKSFVSSNLAVTLAYAGRKTVILEMDLRKPKISVNFGLSPDHPGISNFLADEPITIDELLQKSGIPGLDVIGCGPILPNPSELLEKEKLDEMIQSLRKIYDDVIIDSPPIHLVTDALIIARVADAALYVVRQGYTHKYELDFINEINNANRFPKFTVVFNGVKRDMAGYGYGYSYYNSSYYNNYYTNKEHETFGKKVKAFLKRF